MRRTLRGARLVDAAQDLPAATITIGDGRITAVRALAGNAIAAAGDASEASEVIDVTGMTIVPGFIDVHTHGGGGFNLHTSDPTEIGAYARWVAATGVTGFLVGVVGSPGVLPSAQLAAAAAAMRAQRSAGEGAGAELLGIHLEGPYISPHRRGAHLASWLRTPDPAETEQLLELADGYLRILTLAPELPGAPALIRRLVEAGVTVSIGHTDASYEQAREAIQLGASHVTHCCNAMRPLHHRAPGPIASLAETSAVAGELIADGVHLHPAMVRLLVRLLGPRRTIVITDALAGAGGSPHATFAFNGQPASVVHGVARLADGTITGSVLTMDQALRNVVRITGLPLGEAVGMLTRNPAAAAGAGARKGLLAVGYDADLLLLDDALTLHATISRGVLTYASARWRARLAGGVSASAAASTVILDGSGA